MYTAWFGMASSTGSPRNCSSGRLLRHFRESSSSMLQLSELQRWWEREGEGEKEEEEDGQRTVKELLQGLVDSNALGRRTINAGGSEFVLYWLKGQRSQKGSSDLHDAIGGTPPQTQKCGTPMSTSLRERLKRSRRQFVSPLISSKAAKKPRIATGELSCLPHVERAVVTKLDFAGCSERGGEGARKEEEGSDKRAETGTGSEIGTGSETGTGSENGGDQLLVLSREKVALQRELEEKEERLRKLRMVKVYRSKNDPEELDSLTRKWREASQEAADELVRSSTHDPPPTVAQLLDYLNIDHALIQYSVEEEAFY